MSSPPRHVGCWLSFDVAEHATLALQVAVADAGVRIVEEQLELVLGDDASTGNPVSPYASPSLAEDLAGLPPAYVTTMEFDPLRDEGILYALRLLEAGVSTELHSFPGTFHGSALVPTAAVSRRGAAELMTVLARALTPAPG